MTEQMRTESSFGFSPLKDGVLGTILFGERRAL
jgi:hypothetical protein